MGGSSKQITGYKYHTSFILFIGNAIEKVLGINFDNRGWLKPLVDKLDNPIEVGLVSSPNLYGENEGGVTGQIHARYGSSAQLPVQFYSEYLAKSDIPPLAYQLQSYLAFEDFYVGNSGYMKEMLLWPKRIHVKNDGSAQWYDQKAEIGYKKLDLDVEFNPSDFEIIVYLTENQTTGSHVIQFKSNQKNFDPSKNGGGSGASGQSYFTIDYKIEKKFVNTSPYFIEIRIESTTYGQSSSGSKIKTLLIPPGASFIDEAWCKNSKYDESSNSWTAGATLDIYFLRVLSPEDDLKIHGLDINPIHKIREILTDITAMNKPEAEINNLNFKKAADLIWDEGLGISWAIQEKSCIEAINELCYHIEAGIRINRQTGLYEMVLFRDDWFEESEIHVLAENKIKNIELEVINADEAINQLNVSFYDRSNIKDSSFSIAENASIKNLNGKVNAETIEFPYFMNQRNAEIVSKWKLRQYSSAVWNGSFTTSEKQARKWNRYDIVKINWAKKGIANLPVRILSLKFGGHTSNTVTIEFEEVVSALGNLSTSIVIDESIDNSVQPPKPCNAKVFELPYFEAVQANGERETNAELADNPEAGFVCAIAEKPQSNSLNAALYVNDDNSYEKSATIHYCETVYLEDQIDKITPAFVVKNMGNLASIRIGSQIFINDETMVYQSFDVLTKVLTVKRGALDTVPQNHNADSILYFADDFVAIDSTLYVDGEQVEAKVLTTTPSGILSLNDAETHIIELNSRAIRPYPPANVKINGEYWPETHIVTNDVLITWVHRNREQQTGGEIIGWFDNSVTVEAGVTYSYELISENIVLASASGITLSTATINANFLIPNKAHTLKLWSVRDGYDSDQKFEHSFVVESASLILQAFVSKSQVTGSTVPAAEISINIDESLKANIQVDGSSISGKASAGSIITIEVNE